MRAAATRTILSAVLGLAVASMGCEDDKVPVTPDAATPVDAGGSPAVDAGVSDSGSMPADAASVDGGGAADGGGADAGTLTAAQMRGSYLVNGLLGCGGCHTPRAGTHMNKAFAGTACWTDTAMMDPNMGCLNAPNLTNHATGLANRTDAQIKDMLTKGVRPDGKYLHPQMPYAHYANLTPTDADAVIAYLRTVAGVENDLPANQPPFDVRPTAPLTPILLTEANAIPEVPGNAANVDSARRGRYLAAMVCIECHSPTAAAPAPYDVRRAFEGGRMYGTNNYAANLTPHDTGIKGWTAADIVKVLKMGVDRNGMKVCSPMRPFPMMSDADATDIGNYLLALPPKNNAIPMNCSMP